MEREILVANTRTQKKYKLTADVTTLAELKAVLDTKGIDYEGMSFTEGISNVQLNDDSSQLPHDINYKGKTTNNLVIILTNTTKNIQSGAESRAELFDFIKKNNLQAEVVKTFGKNMTQVKTSELAEFVASHGTSEPEKSEIDTMADDILALHGFNEANTETPNEDYDEDAEEDLSVLAIDAVGAMVRHFAEAGLINYNDHFDALYEEIRDSLN